MPETKSTRRAREQKAMAKLAADGVDFDELVWTTRGRAACTVISVALPPWTSTLALMAAKLVDGTAP